MHYTFVEKKVYDFGTPAVHFQNRLNLPKFLPGEQVKMVVAWFWGIKKKQAD